MRPCARRIPCRTAGCWSTCSTPLRGWSTRRSDGTHGSDKPKDGLSAYFGTGSNTPGNNGADAGRDEYEAGLESIANMLINIVVLAGQDVKQMGSVLEGHLNATAQTDLERIGVIGAPGTHVGPGVGAHGGERPDDRGRAGAALSGRHTAARGVYGGGGGRVDFVAAGPGQPDEQAADDSGAGPELEPREQEQAIKRNLLTVVDKSGFRVLKGVTTQGEGQPFAAIPTRRIVDYAKYGVRSAANPYLGRLNNTRVPLGDAGDAGGISDAHGGGRGADGV